LKTLTPKLDDVQHKWYVVDATDQVLGRLASKVAHILRGKHKPQYAPHLDLGDHVVIINAEKIRLTGKKAQQKFYYRHTGYPGGLRSRNFSELIKKDAAFVVDHAVRGMLPHNKLGRKMIKKLNIYVGSDHPHIAQKPEKLEV